MKAFLQQVKKYTDKKVTLQEVEEMLDNHDCKLLTHGWCECMDLIKELKDLTEDLKN